MADGTTTNRADAIAVIQAALSALGDDEILVLGEVAGRLVAGQQRYGRFALVTDRRDWPTEALEEAADGLAYVAIALLRQARHG